MNRLLAVVVLALLVLAPASNASAQLLAAKDGPIVYGHHHLNVTNVDEAKKFWVDALGGVLTKFGTNNIEIVKFPNALMFMRAQKPTGGTQGHDSRSHRLLGDEPASGRRPHQGRRLPHRHIVGGAAERHGQGRHRRRRRRTGQRHRLRDGDQTM